VTLQRRLHALAPGLTARSVLEKFAAMQMIDVHLPTTDGRELRLTRYTQPEPELQLLIQQLKLQLPPQPPPRITAAAVARATCCSEDFLTFSANSLINNERTPTKTANPRRRASGGLAQLEKYGQLQLSLCRGECIQPALHKRRNRPPLQMPLLPLSIAAEGGSPSHHRRAYDVFEVLWYNFPQ